MLRRLVLPLALALALVHAASAAAERSASVAALQVGLRAHGLYAGPVDGELGPATARAIRALQRKKGLIVDGVAGPQTRAALGRRGRPNLGRRAIRIRTRGWDVAQLQFLLANRGFPSGPIDGIFGPRTSAAVRRFQRFAGLQPDGLAGPATLAALAGAEPASPVQLAWPLQGEVTDGFGPRGARFHAGIDIPAPAGTPVAAAGHGSVTFAGWHAGGFGFLVTVAHGAGVRTLYAHLSSVAVQVGQQVAAGEMVGTVGATGSASGAHLHFEVRVRGAAIDPLSALP